jgi:hypothetical protein
MSAGRVPNPRLKLTPPTRSFLETAVDVSLHLFPLNPAVAGGAA